MNGSMMILLTGDVAAIAIVTLLGFATHGTLGSAGTRMLTTFIPTLLAWLAVAPFLGAYSLPQAREVRNLWRPTWSMALAAPLAVVLRGLWLNSPVVPVFALVLAGVGAAGILLWRLLYILLVHRKALPNKQYG